MSLTINACYVAAEIQNADFNKETFEEVKKILLLELKASGGNYLLIENEPYSKQDLLDYFKNVQQEYFQESGKVVPNVPLQNDKTKTWHNPLTDPISIMHVFEVPNELMNPIKQEEAQELVEKLYGSKIIQVCQQQFKDKNFDQLQFLLSYEFVFSLNLAHEIKRNLSILFNNLCLSIRKEIDENPNLEDVENSIFFQSSFYRVLFFLKDTNEELTRNLMSLGVERMNGNKVTNTHKKNLFVKFKLLSLDQSTLDYVNKNIQYYENRIVVENVMDKKEKKSRKNTVIVVLVFLAAIFLYYKYLDLEKARVVQEINNSDNENNYSDPDQDDEPTIVHVSEVPDQYFEQKDVISDYSQLKANIDSNVTNPQVAAFLKNSYINFVTI